jgi:hypothetical protein
VVMSIAGNVWLCLMKGLTVLFEIKVSKPDEDNDVCVRIYDSVEFYLTKETAKKLRKLLKKAWKDV